MPDPIYMCHSLRLPVLPDKEGPCLLCVCVRACVCACVRACVCVNHEANNVLPVLPDKEGLVVCVLLVCGGGCVCVCAYACDVSVCACAYIYIYIYIYIFTQWGYNHPLEVRMHPCLGCHMHRYLCCIASGPDHRKAGAVAALAEERKKAKYVP